METATKIEVTESNANWKHYDIVGEEGGLKLDIETDSNFLTNTKNLMYDLGNKALKGSLDISEISLPPAMLSEYTRLEMISLEYQPLCHYLLYASKETDMLERMKYIISGYVKLPLI